MLLQLKRNRDGNGATHLMLVPQESSYSKQCKQEWSRAIITKPSSIQWHEKSAPRKSRKSISSGTTILACNVHVAAVEVDSRFGERWLGGATFHVGTHVKSSVHSV